MDVNVHLLPAEKWILSHNIFIWKKCPCSRPFAFVQLGCALGFNRIRLSNQSGYEYLAWQQFREKEREGGERRHCWRQEGTRAWRYKDTATMWATPHLKPCFHVQFTAEPWWFQIWLSGTTDTVSADGVCATRSPPLGCQVRPGQACSPSGSHFSSLAAAHVTGEKNFCKAMMS